MNQGLLHLRRVERAMTGKVHRVRFEPVGIEMEVVEGETVLDAAFRQGIVLPHGCKEGQCSSCKSLLLSGDVDLLQYSTFALPDYEKDTRHILLCRTLVHSDIEVELLNYDEDAMRPSVPVQDYVAKLSGLTPLTHNMYLLEMDLDRPLRFLAGQYVDLTIPGTGITRPFSMANTPSEPSRLRFMIKRYARGAFSGLLDGGLCNGVRLTVKGPYGTCYRRDGRTNPMVLIGSGAGMSALWSILCDQIESRSVRPILFFYGARAKRDLFYLDEFATLTEKLPAFRFFPALSDTSPEDGWTADIGLIQDVVGRRLNGETLGGEVDAYSCGPASMIDALLPVLQIAGVKSERIYFDKFTPAVTNGNGTERV